MTGWTLTELEDLEKRLTGKLPDFTPHIQQSAKQLEAKLLQQFSAFMEKVQADLQAKFKQDIAEVKDLIALEEAKRLQDLERSLTATEVKIESNIRHISNDSKVGIQ